MTRPATGPDDAGKAGTDMGWPDDATLRALIRCWQEYREGFRPSAQRFDGEEFEERCCDMFEGADTAQANGEPVWDMTVSEPVEMS